MYLIPFYDLVKFREAKVKSESNIALRASCYKRYKDKLRKLRKMQQQ